MLHSRIPPRLTAACAVLFCLIATAFAKEPEEVILGLRGRFRPEKPTVSISYNLGYRFLYIQLMRIGKARIEATEGQWLNSKTGKWQPACFMELHLNSLEGGDKSKRGRVYLKNHLVSVLTIPELDTLIHLKRTDEIMNPLFGKERSTDTFHMYNLEDGDDLTYYAEDYGTKSVTTNLTGTVDLAKQGKAISGALQILSSVYYGKDEIRDPDFEIHVDIDGEVLPFAVETRDTRIPIHYLRKRMDVLRVDVHPKKKDIKGKCNARPFVVWGASFVDFAGETTDKDLAAVAAGTMECSMVPLQADFCVTVGRIRCTLVGVELLKEGVEGFRKAGPANDAKE